MNLGTLLYRSINSFDTETILFSKRPRKWKTFIQYINIVISKQSVRTTFIMKNIRLEPYFIYNTVLHKSQAATAKNIVS